uniref:V-ATPase proteolipid subunit C-like domain-containing protein n=1 Tax=Cynodon dactylon x Cynodon transvaalensis TaxID=1920021 RepID=A0A5J6YEN7_9POAL|nr:hypothetical protein [Cynodon dactylon x Cynodon transvaalensis]
MLEGAKSIGAGAATIALAGAAVGIGNVLSSSIHSVARNPSLAKQSFGDSFLYLFFFKLYFFFLKYPFFLYIIYMILFVFLLFFRLILPLGTLFSNLSPNSFFLITLPPEVQSPQALAHLEGLNFYLSLYEQDPEWVAFIQQELNHNTPLEDIPGRLRLFLMEEKISCLRRDLIQDFICLYNRTQLPLEPYFLEEAVRSYLRHLNGSDNLSILQAAYQDLQENERESIFYLETVAHNQDALDAQSASKRCFEEARRIRWEGFIQSKARLERAEHEHALLLFQYEDKKRGRI